MAETHELRLKIDAAAAKRGSREFTAAVDAIKLAVRDLERDSTGAFTKLKKNMDDVAKRGKMKVTGIDRQSIRNVNDFAAAQQKVVTSTANSTKGIKTLISTMRGLSDSYGAARGTSEGLAASIGKVNSGLNRQIQLASQARSAVRQVGTAPATGGTASTGSAAAVASLQKEYANLNKLVASTTSMINASFNKMITGANKAAGATRNVNSEITRMENLQLSSAAAIRRAESEAARLVTRLKQIGDTKGATAVNQSLITLKANMAGGVKSSLELRAAMDKFAASTHGAKASIAGFNASQAAASAQAKALAASARQAASGALAVEKNMRSLAGANNAASQAMRNATGNMRGLENAFSSTFQAGSLFRTMLGSITFGSFISGVFSAGDALDQFRVSMEIAVGSASAAMGEMDYVDEIASRLGVSLQSARDNYSKFSISANIAGVAASDTRRIFESVSTAMAVLGKSTEDQNLAFMALEQMMSKGKVSSEELRRQLGERLPGAVNMMAQALGVTVDKLQEMLKAGEINSADALPKFAEILEDRFGPGLEAASRRAGNNLQKFRNEITLFLEEVAQSGFMQQMAVEFKTLTEALANGAATGAAQRLGEGLANMARIGGDAVMWLVENVDTLATALKAVGIGLITRQLTLMAGALATGIQQVTGYTAAWAANNTVAAKSAAASAAATAARAKERLATAASAQGLLTHTGAQTASMRAALTHRTSILGSAGAMGIFAKSSATATAAAATFSRAMAVAAPILGVALTALLLIPGAMDAIGLGSDNTSVRVEAAMARAGVAFDSFGETVRQTASQSELTRLIRDIETLEAAAGKLSNVTGGTDLLWNLSEFDSLGFAMNNITGEAGSFNASMENLARTFSGMETLDFSNISTGASAAMQDMYNDLYRLEHFAQGDILDIQDKLNGAFIKFGDGGGNTDAILGVFDALISRQVALQQGIANTTDSLTSLYGTQDEQLALEFAEAAKQVLITGDGMDELDSKQRVLAEGFPQIADQLSTIREEMERASLAGDGPLEFQRAMQEGYGGTARTIIALREEVVATQRAVGDASNSMLEGLSSTVSSLQDIDLSEGFFSGFDGIDPEVIAQYEGLFNKFNEFSMSGGMEISAAGMERFAMALTTATPEAARFREELIAQFTALPAAEQTYSRLDSMLISLQQRYPGVRGEVDAMSTAILNNSRGTNTAAISYGELARAVDALPWPTEAARAAAMALLEQAGATQAAGNAAAGAEGQLYAAADGEYAVADGAAAATAEVLALQAALAAMGAQAAGVQAAAATIVDNINYQTERTLAPIRERGLMDFNRDMAAQVQETYEAALAAMPAADRSGGPLLMAAQADREAAMQEIARAGPEILAATDGLISAQATDAERRRAASATGRSGGGGGGGRGATGGGGGSSRAAELSDEQKAMEQLNNTLKDRLTSLEAERIELGLLSSGQFETAEAARLMAEAMVQGGGSVDAQTEAMIRQIDAAAALNEELKKVATDPVKEWMDSVPNWIEAGQQIEMGAIGSLKTAISDFIKTGTFDLESLGESILGVIADIVADKAVAELMNMFGRNEDGAGGLGGLLGGFLGSQGDALTGPTAGGGADVAQGGVQAGQTISQAMVQAGQQVSQSLTTAMTQGGNSAAAQQRTAGVQTGAQIRTATTTSGNTHANTVRQAIVSGGQQHANAVGMAAGGGGGGGFLSGLGGWGGIASMALGAFAEGGMSNSPVGTANVSPGAFKNAPHFAQGTSNTSGIPAVLHPNEAVIPLSKGRKIPIDMGDQAAGGGSQTVVQTYNISTPDADSFRKSQKQIAAEGASSAQRAMNSNR